MITTRRWVNWAIHSLGLLVLLIVLLRVDFSQVLLAAGKIRICSLLTILLLAFLVNATKGLRLYYLLGQFERRYTLANCIITTFVGNYLGAITPGRVGELAQAYYLKKDARIPLSLSVPLLVYTRVFDLYMVVVICVAGAIGFHAEFLSPPIKLLFVLIFVVISGFIFVPKIFLKILFFVRTKVNARWGGNNFLPSFRFSLLTVLNLLCITLGIYIFLFGRCILLAKGMGIGLSWGKLIFFIAVVNILAYIPISVAGLGTTQVALIYFFHKEGISVEIAVAYSMLLFGVVYLWGIILGAIAWLIKPIKLSSTNNFIQEA